MIAQPAKIAAATALLVGALAILATALAATAAYDRQLATNLFYRVPSGYRAVEQPGGVLMIRSADLAQGTIGGFLLAVPEIPLDEATANKIATVGRPAFAQAVAVTAGNLADDPNATIGEPSVAGDVYRVDTKSFDASAGKQRYSRFEIAFVGDFIHIFVAAGYGTPADLDAQLPGLAELFASIGYRNKGAPAPTRLAPPLPTQLAAIMDTPQAAPPQSGKRCRIVQRQMCSGGIGTSLGYFCNTYPQQVCDRATRIVQSRRER